MLKVASKFEEKNYPLRIVCVCGYYHGCTTGEDSPPHLVPCSRCHRKFVWYVVDGVVIIESQA